MIVGYHPVGASTCLHKEEVGKPSHSEAHVCAKAVGCDHEDKGWEFRVST